jgi:hypothetical protein
MLGGLCGLTSWLLRISLEDDVPGTLCCLKIRPAGEVSRDERGEVRVEGEREVDVDSDPPLSPLAPRGICESCVDWRSFGCACAFRGL